MSALFSIALFLSHILLFGYGTTALLLRGRQKPNLEHFLILLCVGLAVTTLIPFLLGLFFIPINIHIITGLGIVLAAVAYFIQRKQEAQVIDLSQLQLQKKIIPAFLLVLVFLLNILPIYTGLGTSQDLENGDPWGYVCLGHYIAQEQSYKVSEDVNCGVDQLYIKPLPRRFTVLNGVYQQVSDSPQAVIKWLYFSLYSVAILGFLLYFWLLFKKVYWTALAGFFLASIPGFIGRFLYEQNIGLLLLGPLLALLLLVLQGKKEYTPLLGIVFGAQIISHPPTSIFGALIFGSYFVLTLITEYKQKHHKRKQTKYTLTKQLIFSAVIALGILLLYLLNSFFMYGSEAVVSEGASERIIFGLVPTEPTERQVRWLNQYNYPHNLEEVVIAQRSSAMDQARGLGLIFSIIVLIGLVASIVKGIRKAHGKTIVHSSLLIIILLFLFFGWKTGFAIFSSRLWPLAALFAVILATQGTQQLLQWIPGKYTKVLVILLILIGVYFTSFVQHNTIQTSTWPQHQYSYQGDATGYNWMYENLPKGTEVFPLCRHSPFLIGLDMYYNYSSPEYRAFYEEAKTANSTWINEQIIRFDKQILLIERRCFENWGVNATQEIVSSLEGSYQVLHFQEPTFLLLGKI